MKLKDFLKVVNPVDFGKTVIWGDDNLNPLWEGDGVFDIPWWAVDLKIGNKEKDADEPISMYPYVNEYGANRISLVINVIE